MILLLSATGMEQALVCASLSDRAPRQVAGRNWFDGKLAGVAVRLIETGLGSVNAAHAVTCALEMDSPELVLQFGVGGAYRHGRLEVGDLALASEENYGDLGIKTRAGWQGSEEIGIPILEVGGKTFFNRYPADEASVEQTWRLLDRAVWDGVPPRVKVGPFVTLQECSGTTALGAERGRRFAAICENMEGAAVAHLCCLYDVPFIEVRGISNLVEDRDCTRWDLPLAASRAQEAVRIVLGGEQK